MSTTRKATEDGGLRGMTRISAYPTPMDNRPDVPSLADRRAELKALVNLALQRCAELVVKRSWYSAPKDADRVALYDAARGRRPANAENIARVIAHGGADELAESLYQLGRRHQPTPCVREASLAETQANGPLNEVQEKLAADPTNPAYLEAAYEYVMKQIAASRDYAAALSHKLQKVNS
jgi:hypothetical protein